MLAQGAHPSSPAALVAPAADTAEPSFHNTFVQLPITRTARQQLAAGQVVEDAEQHPVAADVPHRVAAAAATDEDDDGLDAVVGDEGAAAALGGGLTAAGPSSKAAAATEVEDGSMPQAASTSAADWIHRCICQLLQKGGRAGVLLAGRWNSTHAHGR